MPRFVLIRHLPGRSSSETGPHDDLLLERESSTDRRLLAFRLDHGIELLSVAEFQAERIPDHRAVYLDYEGPLPAPGGSASQAGGSVSRSLAGACTIHMETPEVLEVTLRDGDRQARFLAQRVHACEPWWRFVRT